MIYLIADTHGSDVVVPNDCETLIHVGDYIRGAITGGIVRILVRGNHDTERAYTYFHQVVDGLLLDNVWITHEPAFTLPLGAHINVHGHLHDNPYEEYGYIQRPFHKLLEPNKLYSWGELCGQPH